MWQWSSNSEEILLVFTGGRCAVFNVHSFSVLKLVIICCHLSSGK